MPQAACGGGRGAVGGQRLGAGAEVQAGAGRQPQRPALAVETDCAPARDQGRLTRGRVGRECGEVAVVAGGDQRRADRRVDQPAGPAGDVERHRDGLCRQLAHAHRGACRGVRALEVGVGAKAAAGGVDGVQLTLHRPPGGGQRAGVGDRDEGASSPAPARSRWRGSRASGDDDGGLRRRRRWRGGDRRRRRGPGPLGVTMVASVARGRRALHAPVVGRARSDAPAP